MCSVDSSAMFELELRSKLPFPLLTSCVNSSLSLVVAAVVVVGTQIVILVVAVSSRAHEE